MASVIIKDDERRAHEAYVMQQFGQDCRTADSGEREQAELIAARTREAYETMKKMEG